MNQKIVVIAIAVFAAIGCGEKEQEFTTQTQKEIVLSGSNTEKTEEKIREVDSLLETAEKMQEKNGKAIKKAEKERKEQAKLWAGSCGNKDCGNHIATTEK